MWVEYPILGFIKNTGSDCFIILDCIFQLSRIIVRVPFIGLAIKLLTYGCNL